MIKSSRSRPATILAGLLAGAALILALPAAAQQAAGEATGTLRKIRDQGAIYLGYREGAVPFSYVDERDEVRGYTWDLCGQVVVAIREALGRPDLKIVPVPVTVSNRLMLVRAGTIDLECAATAVTPSRERQVAFSRTTYIGTVKALVKADSSLRTLADLDGKRVVTTLGSASERYVKTASPLRSAVIDYVSADSHAASLETVATGKADAFVLDEAPLVQLKAGATDPAAFRLLDDNLAIEPHAIALPREDAAFKQLVDGALDRLISNGEMERLYAKWFQQPLPGIGISLGLPMSNLLKEALRVPPQRL